LYLVWEARASLGGGLALLLLGGRKKREKEEEEETEKEKEKRRMASGGWGRGKLLGGGLLDGIKVGIAILLGEVLVLYWRMGLKGERRKEGIKFNLRHEMKCLKELRRKEKKKVR